MEDDADNWTKLGTLTGRIAAKLKAARTEFRGAAIDARPVEEKAAATLGRVVERDGGSDAHGGCRAVECAPGDESADGRLWGRPSALRRPVRMAMQDNAGFQFAAPYDARHPGRAVGLALHLHSAGSTELL